MKTVLVTGATGYLGKALCKRLKARHRLICLRRMSGKQTTPNPFDGEALWMDADSDSEIEKAFEEQKIDAVIHLATHYGRDGDLLATFRANLLLPLRLAQMCVDHGVKEFINADSYYNKESHACGHLSAYTMSKRQVLEWLSLYAARMCVSNVRIEHVYGPGDAESKFVNDLARRILSGQARIAMTSGEQRRDFIYVEDVAKAFEAILERPGDRFPGMSLYQAGTGEPLSVREFATRMKEKASSRSILDFGALPMRDGEIMESRADASALFNLGWKPDYDIETGLDALLDGESEDRDTVKREDRL